MQISKQIENYVCTLEQAKRLRELGMLSCGDSLYYFFEKEIYSYCYAKQEKLKFDEEGISNDYEIYRAFTSQELGELICEQLDEGLKSFTEGSNLAGEYLFCYRKGSVDQSTKEAYLPFIKYDGLKNEAQARAAFLIHLLEVEENDNIRMAAIQPTETVTGIKTLVGAVKETVDYNKISTCENCQHFEQFDHTNNVCAKRKMLVDANIFNCEYYKPRAR